MVPFESLGTVFFAHSVVAMAVSLAVAIHNTRTWQTNTAPRYRPCLCVRRAAKKQYRHRRYTPAIVQRTCCSLLPRSVILCLHRARL